MELWETFFFLLPITPFRLTGHAQKTAQIYHQNFYFSILGEINDHFIQIAC